LPGLFFTDIARRLKNIYKIFKILNPKERAQALLIFILIFFMALFDVLGIASIMPFIAVALNTNLIFENKYLFLVYNYYNFETSESFIFFLGLSCFFILFFTLVFKSITTYYQLNFTFMREYSLSKLLFEKYINQPYEWFLDKNSSELNKSILSEVHIFVSGALLPFMVIVAQSFVSIAIIILIFIVDFKIAIFGSLILSLSYGLIYLYIRNFLNNIGNKRFKTNSERFKLVTEVFSIFKHIKIRDLENFYVNKFKQPAKLNAKYHAQSQIIAQVPRFGLELIAFGSLIFLSLIFISVEDDFKSSIAIIALYAFAGYRLMPALQQIYSNYSVLKFSKVTVDQIFYDIYSLKNNVINNQKFSNFNFNKSIRFDKIFYKYPKSDRFVLNDISFKINYKSTVAFVGQTGSGKSTIADLLIRLLIQTDGNIYIDDTCLDSSNYKYWQRKIGYVPQQTHLIDDSIMANIAVGYSKNQIDKEKIIQVSKIANLHNFITNNLKDGYSTHIGENGVKLSGGQRQRISIARALYSEPKILILDEATSALDNIVEKNILNNIKNFNNEVTIVLITHRISTTNDCDQIILLKDGKINGIGNFEDLKTSNKLFIELAEKDTEK
tara:strand:- start:24704 stop:26536 length:1833 start_codon:yes stop_codon:yes gene_type:complete